MVFIQRSGSVGAPTLLCVLLGVTSPSVAQSPRSSALHNLSPSDLAALNRMNANAVDTCVRVDRMITRIKTLPGEEKRLRSNLTSGTMNHMDKMIISATEKGMTDDVLKRILDDKALRLATIDGQVLISRLNKFTSNRFTSRIDFGASRARYDVVDLRDLDALCKKAGLGALQRMSLDRSKAIVSTKSSALHRITRDGNDIVFDGGKPRFTDEVRRRFGIVPTWVCDESYLLECRYLDSGTKPAEIDIVGRHANTKKVAFDLTLRPDLDFLMARFRRYDDDGDVIEFFSAWDFRRVDGVLIPFQFKLQVSREGVADYLVEQTSLQSIKLNVDLPEKLFEMPKSEYGVRRP